MIRLGVDAINLRADGRGMGRVVRNALAGLAGRAELTLLLRDRRDVAPLRAALPAGIAFAGPAAARDAARLDAVWYPWNGVRFRSAVPGLVTVYDDFAFRYPARGFIARRREQEPIRRAFGRGLRLTTISQWSRAALAERFAVAADRIAILPLAPDPFFSPSGPADDEAAQRFVLVVGGSEERKNVAGFAASFAAAFPQREARLVVVGNPARSDRARLADLGATVLAAGDEDLRTLYRSARAVAIPSLAEGYGLTVVEAQACGAAVLASATSALPEAVGDAGLLVAPGDRAGWIAALRAAVLDDAVNARLRAASAARWAFAPRDVTAPALLGLLTDLVDDRA